MLTRRRFVGHCLTLAASFGLAACAPPTPASPPAATAKPAEPTAAKPAEAKPAATVPAATTAPATAPNAAGKPQYKVDLGGYTGPAPTDAKISLRMVRSNYPPAPEKYWKDRIDEWQTAYPNITIQEEIVPYGDLNLKLQTSVAAGDPPDIIMGKGDFVRAYVFNKLTVDMAQFLSKDYLDDLTPAVKSQNIVDGKLWAWPWEHGQVLLYFNKDLFRKAGVETPPETLNVNEGWTWEQLMAAQEKLAAALSTADPTTFALAASTYGNGGPGSSWWYEGQYVRSLGDPNAPKDSSAYKTFAGVNDDGTSVAGYLDTPETVAGLKYYQQIFQKKLTPAVPTPNQFEDGKAATRYSSLSLALRFKNQEGGAPFQWGATPVPHGKILFNHISGDAPIVVANTKYIAESAAFMALHHTDRNRINWHNAWGATPTRVSLFEKMGYTTHPEKLALEMTKVGYPPPSTPGYLEYFSAMNTAVKDIALGANVEDRVSKVAKEIETLLAPYKK